GSLSSIALAMGSGRAMNTLLGLLMLYIVLLMFNFGEFSGYIEQYNIYYNVDLSPLNVVLE
ncbi:hypothetical protein, partial [Serratia marcescens]|uniref:hypothetical protein n=1 Tax=Serratia marcescens TaxID=615 RepID=UPI001953D64E